MTNLMNRIGRFIQSEDGPTAVEYAVMLALILVACIVIIGNLGDSVSSTFNAVDEGIQGQGGG